MESIGKTMDEMADIVRDVLPEDGTLDSVCGAAGITVRFSSRNGVTCTAGGLSLRRPDRVPVLLGQAPVIFR